MRLPAIQDLACSMLGTNACSALSAGNSSCGQTVEMPKARKKISPNISCRHRLSASLYQVSIAFSLGGDNSAGATAACHFPSQRHQYSHSNASRSFGQTLDRLSYLTQQLWTEASKAASASFSRISWRASCAPNPAALAARCRPHFPTSAPSATASFGPHRKPTSLQVARRR